MKAEQRIEYVTRDAILKLLSDDEVARVSTAEIGPPLADGDEYVDLQNPDHGIRRWLGQATAPMEDTLPRTAVQDHTWRQIVALLSAHRAGATPHSHTG